MFAEVAIGMFVLLVVSVLTYAIGYNHGRQDPILHRYHVIVKGESDSATHSIIAPKINKEVFKLLGVKSTDIVAVQIDKDSVVSVEEPMVQRQPRVRESCLHVDGG